MLYRSDLTIFSIDNQHEKGSKKNAMVWSTTAYFPSNKIKIGKSGKFSDLTFGGSSYPYGYFTGVIDELKLYNRALSSEEISMLYRIN